MLRDGRKFIERFLRTLPLMEQQFNFQQDAVLAILKPIQAGTRQLHAIMGHGKMGRDAKLAREMPKARKALELLTFRIKELAHENDCFGAIEVAGLKHRELDGTEIASEEEDEDEDEDEEEDDDEDDDDGDDDEEDDEDE